MKRVILPLLAALLLAPATLQAAPAVAPVSTSVTAVTPVDDLLKLLNPLLKIMMQSDGDAENLSKEQELKFNALVGSVNTLKSLYGSYQLTSADRESLLRWARAKAEEFYGEKMTAEEVAETRAELAAYKTLADLIDDLDLETL